MGIRKDTNAQAPSTAQFAAESVLGRMGRGGYKPTEEDLADLEKLAGTGNRAERRAAGKHLKRHGIAAPQAAPRQPVIAPLAPPAPAPASKAKPKEAPAAPAEAPPAKAPAKKSAVKKTVVKKEAGKKAPAKKAALTKAPVKKAAAKKAAAKKTPPRK